MCVIVLFGEEYDEINEREWLRATANNPAFAFLKDPAEDIYTLEDGEPFDAKHPGLRVSSPPDQSGCSI